METLLQEIRYSLRMLLKSPAVSLIALLSIALGIGANTTVFSVVNTVLLKAMPFKDPDSLVLVWGDSKGHTSLQGRNQVSATDVADFRNQATVFEDVTTFTGWNPLMSGNAQAERVPAIQVGDGFFTVMKGTPILGRTFTREEQEDGKDYVIVLGYGLWQRRFGSDPNVVGKTVSLNSRSYTIVGVMGPDFRALPSSLVSPEGQFYRPVAEAYNDKQRDERHLRAIARLKPGVTVEQAKSELNVIAQRIEREHPTTNKDQGANVVSLAEDTVGRVSRTLWLVFGAVIFVLLVACANVANLLLARATGRYKEITIRAAIGANRAQLARQLLTESMLLALVGGVLGLLLAMWGIGIVEELGEKINPMFRDINIDPLCVVFTFGLSVLTGLFFGIAPALQLSKPNLAESLKEGGRSAGGLAGRNRFRGGLVVAEIAMTLVLLVCAGLLVRTVIRLRNVDIGFNPHNVLAMNIGLPAARYPKPENVVSFYKEITERIAALPGVKAAGITSVLPLSDNFDGRGLSVEDHPETLTDLITVDLYVTTAGYLRAMEIPILEGRAINEQDTTESNPVALINRAMANELWPNQNPIGKRIKLPGSERAPLPWRTIVGVVSDVAQYGLDKKAPMQMYLPHSQFPTTFDTIVVKTENDAAAMTNAVRGQILAVDKDQAVYNITTLDQLQSEAVLLRRLFMVLLVTFAVIGLILAAIGIYGVMSYAVTQRTQEIGIRMALGAQAADVLRLVVGNGMALALLGVAIGLVSAFALTRLMETVLFGVTTTDAATYAVVAFGLIAVALVACYIPARRATKVDPLVALRYE